MNSAGIATNLLFLAFFLSATWGFYMTWTIKEWFRVRGLRQRRRSDLVVAFRRMIVAICVFLLPASVLFRTTTVILGVDQTFLSQVTFFAILGPNVVGSIYAVISLWYDDGPP